MFPKAEKEPDNPQQVADVIDLTETDSEEEYEFEDGDDSGKEESDSSSNDDRSVWQAIFQLMHCQFFFSDSTLGQDLWFILNTIYIVCIILHIVWFMSHFQAIWDILDIVWPLEQELPMSAF